MRVAIAGYGAEGKANYQYWRDKGDELVIVDERTISPYDMPYGAEAIMGKNAFKRLADFDMVVRTASLNPKKLKKAKKIWSGTNEFFTRCPAPIVGVTGTKGKGTVCSMIARVLNASGKNTHVVGNIGTPALGALSDIKPDDIVVYELSSFQLWDCGMSPHVAVVLSIEADHLDAHKNMKEYIDAKSNICKHQRGGDMCFYHPNNQYAREIAHLGGGGAKKFGSRTEGTVYVKNDAFFIDDTEVCGTNAVRLPGAHNIENACAALSVAKYLGADNDSCRRGLEKFSGLEHRLALVREVDSVKYYDDSISTTPGSAMAALRAFDQPKVIILGGYFKGSDYVELVHECKKSGTKVVAIGETGAKIQELCNKIGVRVERVVGDMPDIVAKAQQIAEPGSVVLLSPASASFDMFKNVYDRAEQFVGCVNGL